MKQRSMLKAWGTQDSQKTLDLGSSTRSNMKGRVVRDTGRDSAKQQSSERHGLDQI
jgi:hypothetical protein